MEVMLQLKAVNANATIREVGTVIVANPYALEHDYFGRSEPLRLGNMEDGLPDAAN